MEHKMMLALEATLPCCGLVVKMCNREADPMPVGTAAEAFIDLSAQRLAYWYVDRSTRHRCELVSEDNLMGLEPKA